MVCTLTALCSVCCVVRFKKAMEKREERWSVCTLTVGALQRLLCGSFQVADCGLRYCTRQDALGDLVRVAGWGPLP